MTNHYIDLKNSDCILIMGSNAAENHPIAFKWIMRAKDRGAKIIHVDPRYTRTSARCDYHVPLRSGTDIAFLGGMIKYIIDNNLIQEEYVKYYTNASQIISADYDFKDGLFSGFDAEKGNYNKETWTIEKDEKGIPIRDYTLENPRCVYQMLKKHYERYTLDTVSSITGVSKENLLKVYNEYGATGAKDKAGTECYALGWTHHTVGSQNIRAMSIIQLLLGNMGICGGGINALRGEPNVQGSTDHAILYNILPGYLKMPSGSIDTLPKYIDKYTSKSTDPQSANWYQNYPKYTVSFLKAMWGDKATADNDFGYSWLPKLDDGKHYSILHTIDQMYAGKIKGFFAYGSNIAVSSPNSTKVRKGSAKTEVAGQRQYLRQRDRLVLEGARRRSEDHRYRGLPPARRGQHGKRRQPEQLRPLGAVALQGRQSAGRCPVRRRYHHADHGRPSRPLPEGRGRLSGADPQSEVGL